MIVGIDEVGRGAFAGPVVVGAFMVADEKVLTTAIESLLSGPMRDSKQLSPKMREQLVPIIEQYGAVAIGEAPASAVDSLGIVEALRLAAGKALSNFSGISAIYADAGLHHPFETRIPTEWFVKGDERMLSIACASVCAKVFRDRLMTDLHGTYPIYHWDTNAGYGTKVHREALRIHGLSPEHRRSFCSKTLGAVLG